MFSLFRRKPDPEHIPAHIRAALIGIVTPIWDTQMREWIDKGRPASHPFAATDEAMRWLMKIQWRFLPDDWDPEG